MDGQPKSTWWLLFPTSGSLKSHNLSSGNCTVDILTFGTNISSHISAQPRETGRALFLFDYPAIGSSSQVNLVH